MTYRTEFTLCTAWFLLCCPSRAAGDKLQITSTPAGATVELDGVAPRVTPPEKAFPGGDIYKIRINFWLPNRPSTTSGPSRPESPQTPPSRRLPPAPPRA